MTELTRYITETFLGGMQCVLRTAEGEEYPLTLTGNGER